MSQAFHETQSCVPEALLSGDASSHLSLPRLLIRSAARLDARVLHFMVMDPRVPLGWSRHAMRAGFAAGVLHLARHLGTHEARSVDLARRAGLSKQAMGMVVIEAVRWGLVVRQPDPMDARAMLVGWTPLGLEWRQAHWQAVQRAEAEFASQVGHDVAAVTRWALEVHGAGDA